jgi:carbon storage regulator CsrA
MLVLTRKLQQHIKIGEEITVTILRVKGNTVRVGIQAPREMRVIRGELPKTGAAEGGAPLTVEKTSGQEAASAEAPEAADDTAGPARQPLALFNAAHLPLRKIANRHGSAPLKRIVAACSTLAK